MNKCTKEILIKELCKIINPLHIKLIEFSAKMGRNGLNIKIIIDKYKGVTIDDCEKIARLYNDRLSILDIMEEENYNLQISSPGIDRSFKSKDEYNIFSGRRVKVYLKEIGDLKKIADLKEIADLKKIRGQRGSNIITGLLRGIENNIVKLEVNSEIIEITLDKIRS